MVFLWFSHGFPICFLFFTSICRAAKPLSNWRAQVYKDNSDHSLKLIDFGFAKAFKEDRWRRCHAFVMSRLENHGRNQIYETMEKPKTSSLLEFVVNLYTSMMYIHIEIHGLWWKIWVACNSPTFLHQAGTLWYAPTSFPIPKKIKKNMVLICSYAIRWWDKQE